MISDISRGLIAGLLASSALLADENADVCVPTATGTGNSDWYVSPLVALMGVLVGALVVIWQTNRQQRIGSVLQRERAREELKVDLYSRVRSEIDAVHDSSSRLTSYVSFLPATFQTYKTFTRDGIKPAPIRQRALEFLDLNAQFGGCISTLTKTLEDFEVVEPNIRVFQRALLSIEYDIQQAFQPLYKELSYYLPIDLPAVPGSEGGVNAVFPSFPSDEKVDEIGVLIQKHWQLTLNLTAYLYDLRREAQNQLLGHLFDHRVATRTPPDPDVIVLTTNPEKAERLIQHFETQTAWGRLRSGPKS